MRVFKKGVGSWHRKQMFKKTKQETSLLPTHSTHNY